MYITILSYITFLPFRFFNARSPSLRLMNATKPQFLCLAFSSSLRGHIIFILASGPYLPNISINCCSVIYKREKDNYCIMYYVLCITCSSITTTVKYYFTFGFKFPRYKFVVFGSPLSNEPSVKQKFSTFSAMIRRKRIRRKKIWKDNGYPRISGLIDGDHQRSYAD